MQNHTHALVVVVAGKRGGAGSFLVGKVSSDSLHALKTGYGDKIALEETARFSTFSLLDFNKT